MTDFCSCCEVIFNESDNVFSTPCGHIFHQDCLFNATFVLSNENKGYCPICGTPCTSYDTERLYSHFSICSKKEAAIHDIEQQLSKKRMQIQRSINRNKNNTNELQFLMEETKEIQKKINQINQIKMRNLRKVQGGGPTCDEGKKESPSIVATIQLKRALQIQELNDEIEILDVKIFNLPHKII